MLKQYKILFCLEKLSSFGLKGLKLQNKCFFSSSTGKKDEETEKPPEFFDPKKKISNNTFLKIELSQNPEFDKAFPFLRSHKKPSTLFRKDEELDFIDSLRFF